VGQPVSADEAVQVILRAHVAVETRELDAGLRRRLGGFDDGGNRGGRGSFGGARRENGSGCHDEKALDHEITPGRKLRWPGV